MFTTCKTRFWSLWLIIQSAKCHLSSFESSNLTTQRCFSCKYQNNNMAHRAVSWINRLTKTSVLRLRVGFYWRVHNDSKKHTYLILCDLDEVTLSWNVFVPTDHRVHAQVKNLHFFVIKWKWSEVEVPCVAGVTFLSVHTGVWRSRKWHGCGGDAGKRGSQLEQLQLSVTPWVFKRWRQGCL